MRMILSITTISPDILTVLAVVTAMLTAMSTLTETPCQEKRLLLPLSAATVSALTMELALMRRRLSGLAQTASQMAETQQS